MEQVVPIDGEGRRDDRGSHHDGQRVPAEDAVEAASQQDHVHDVEQHEGHERPEQGDDDAAVAKLAARLDHLRKPQVRSLRRVEGHEQGAERDTQRPGQDRLEHREPDRGPDEPDRDREELEVAQEPERTLLPDLAVAL